ncbi:hypothetical protein [uncultured Roseobacter sp.]|uniref:hypothetical protein n=1 Tax=uncultured Roseobacter sp. TaxID=114847 RepID=UPI0026038EF3|nr:hypothetical protein [uncultured Roseobacter sp.]
MTKVTDTGRICTQSDEVGSAWLTFRCLAGLIVLEAQSILESIKQVSHHCKTEAGLMMLSIQVKAVIAHIQLGDLRLKRKLPHHAEKRSNVIQFTEAMRLRRYQYGINGEW